MKIVPLDEFLKMPEGTFFCYYEPEYVGPEKNYPPRVKGLYKKGQNCSENAGDFMLIPLIPRFDNDGNLEIDLMWERDGSLDDYQMFAVYEEADVKVLRELVNEL